MKTTNIALHIVIIVIGIARVGKAQSSTDPPASAPATDTFLQGQPRLADALSGRAREAYDAGHLLLGDRDYAGALVQFRRAFELSGDVRLLWNLAACEKNLRHYARALRLLERYRADAGAHMTDGHRTEVNELVQALDRLISHVRIEVDESEASVFVDGELRGRTPLTEALLVDLGQHHIRVVKPGFVDAIIMQEMTGGSELTIPITLLRAPQPEDTGKTPGTPVAAAPVARLAVKATPGATIWIDGQRVGQQPWSGELQPGAHTLRVTAPGMLDQEQPLVLQAGDSQTLSIALKDRPFELPTLVWVGAGVVAVSGLVVGGYFLVRGSSEPAPYVGSLEPGTIQLPAARH